MAPDLEPESELILLAVEPEPDRSCRAPAVPDMDMAAVSETAFGDALEERAFEMLRIRLLQR